MFTAEDKAAILVEALPYIQQFYGKTIVIKYLDEICGYPPGDNSWGRPGYHGVPQKSRQGVGLCGRAQSHR